MKTKIFALLIALMLCFGALVACQSGGTAPEGNEPEQQEVTTFEVGNFTVGVPAGWTAFTTTDMFADDPNTVNPNQIQICKGGETQFDLFSKPYVQFDYYGPDKTMMRPTKDIYENGADLEAITAGEYTWEGFTADSGDNKLAVLFLEIDEERSFQATVWYNVDGNAINLTDADVLQILASVVPGDAK